MKVINAIAVCLAVAIIGQATFNCSAQGVVIKPSSGDAPRAPEPIKVADTNVFAGKTNSGALAAPDESKGPSLLTTSGAAHFFIETGAYLLNPYKIDPDTQELEPGDTEASVYVQVNYANIWAFTPNRRQRLLEEPCLGVGRDSTPSGVSTWLGFDGAIDLQAKMGFVFQGDDTPTASTVVGSGDFMSEVTFSYLFYRDLRLNTATAVANDINLAQSVGIDISYGAVTDRAAFDVHHRLFIGPSYCAAIAMGDGRESLIHFRLGGAAIETVSYLNSTTREVEFERGYPKFSLEWALAFEAEAYVPVMKQSFLIFGTRIYGGPDPNLWTAYIGLTRPLDNIVGWLFP
jgi:hypothetical protein